MYESNIMGTNKLSEQRYFESTFDLIGFFAPESLILAQILTFLLAIMKRKVSCSCAQVVAVEDISGMSVLQYGNLSE